jgi:hypothetical protein
LKKATLEILPARVFVTGAPRSIAPENSNTDASPTIWVRVNTFEPNVVPKEFARSLAPIPHASMKELIAPATNIHVYIFMFEE